jgi:uncharacterized protein
MADANVRGRFVWHELMTPDTAKAESFYTKVIGWGTQAWTEGPEPYTMWTAAGSPVGGLMALPAPGAPVAWIAYIGVPDVDSAAKQAQSLGGRIEKQPTDIPVVGRFAVIADPQGAFFCLFTPARDQPGRPDEAPRVGEFSWHELMTSDWQGAWRFYDAMFGWEKRGEHDMGPMGTYLLFGHAGREIGGMFNIPAGNPAPPNWLHYIQVDSADDAAARARANGGTVINGPMDVPGGDRIAQCVDPQGAMFAVHSRKAS